MKKYDNIIAIDPDTQKSGVAYLKISTEQLEVSNLSFPDLLDYIQRAKSISSETGESVLIIVEAGWKHSKSDFRDIQGKAATRIAKNVGANHETGRKIIEMCKHYGLDVMDVFPLKKCWNGIGGKITQEEIEIITGLKGRTNQDGRDAALIAWCYAGLPIRVKVDRK